MIRAVTHRGRVFAPEGHRLIDVAAARPGDLALLVLGRRDRPVLARAWREVVRVERGEFVVRPGFRAGSVIVTSVSGVASVARPERPQLRIVDGGR